MTETIPLPSELANCGCPMAAGGRHKTSCIPAREHDAIPLMERSEYVEGARFQAISWDYPLRFDVSIHVSVEVDPVAYITEHRDEYEKFEMQPGFQEWEKPMCFISERIEEDYGDVGWSFGGRRYVSRVDSYMDDITEHPRWTAEDTERLHSSFTVRPVIDPNQETLFDE